MAGISMQDNQMQAVPIDDLSVRPQVLVDYYLRLSPNKFILVAKMGTNANPDLVQKYKAKNVTSLYVRLEDYLRLVQVSVQTAGVTAGVKGLSDWSRLVVMEDAMAAVYREAQDLGFNDTVFAHAKLVNHATIMFLESEPALSDLVVKLAKLTNVSVKHSMMVSLVSAMIGQGHDWIKPATLEKLALGGFLHDIGKTKLPPEIASKAVERMTHDEKIIYQSHPEVGRQLLAALKTVPDDVLLIVYEHHELCDGSGFPRGLRDYQTSPLARVVSLANAFCSLITALPGGPSVHSAARALEELEFQRSGQFNREAVRALHKMIHASSGPARVAG